MDFVTTHRCINKFGPNLAKSLAVAILKNALLLAPDDTEYTQIAPRCLVLACQVSRLSPCPIFQPFLKLIICSFCDGQARPTFIINPLSPSSARRILFPLTILQVNKQTVLENKALIRLTCCLHGNPSVAN